MVEVKPGSMLATNDKFWQFIQWLVLEAKCKVCHIQEYTKNRELKAFLQQYVTTKVVKQLGKPSDSQAASSPAGDVVDTIKLVYDFRDTTEDEDATAEESGAGMWSYLRSIAVGKSLTEADLEPVVAKFRGTLHAKNVACEISEKLCQSVAASLVGKKFDTFQSMTQTVHHALEDALSRILMPKKTIDVLQEVATHRRAHPDTPYVIAFMGVTGVGKSTNLAKVGSWLHQTGFKVMFAACYTFRSGAVEQLKVRVASQR
eukprot:TRINITY_DN430_c0_g3_i4.p1 TRINITY_DN430_c0_g3~~TRINITY_DN430_c0_g3_i4.p1  ORF type:complete len:276 (+),score=92.48 TRINITY_DN430_c0_g3_i4:54-830(+)